MKTSDGEWLDISPHNHDMLNLLCLVIPHEIFEYILTTPYFKEDISISKVSRPQKILTN